MRPRTRTPTPRSSERDILFWGFMLAALALWIILGVLDDSTAFRQMEKLTSHGSQGPGISIVCARTIMEHLYWMLIALPVLGLIFRWFPLQGKGARPLPCPVWAIPLLALQLVVGCAYLTGLWTHTREQYWFPEPMTFDEIRSISIPRDLPIVRRLEQIIPENASISLIGDEGATPIFLNYYLYPRAISNTAGLESLTTMAANKSFWIMRRRDGFQWVFLYRPFSDKRFNGALYELTDESKSPSQSVPPGAAR